MDYVHRFGPGTYVWSYGVIQLKSTVTKYHLYIQSLSARKVLDAQMDEATSAEFQF